MRDVFKNKSILITGGTGSFGSKMMETLVKKFKPKKIIIFSRDELKQSQLQEKFSKEKYKNLRYFIGDIRDLERLKIAFNKVDIVIHAAALKQVTTAEYNPIEFIKTNITGSENVIKAALDSNVEKVIALSTDKAVNPLNLYGATKLVAEKLFISANNIFGDKRTRFALVRYGNVIGSRGSVVDVFKNIIKANKTNYLPITDKNMTRFWMKLEESINLVIESIGLMRGGETFIPKLKSIRILDLAKAMEKNKKIKFIGVRPGEKIDELLTTKSNDYLTIEFKNHYVVMPSTLVNIDRKSFIKNKRGETGRQVKKEFEYSSGTNKKFMTIKEISNNLN